MPKKQNKSRLNPFLKNRRRFLPHLPGNVDIEDLKENGKLLSDKDYKKAIAWFRANPRRVMLQDKNKYGFNIIKLKNENGRIGYYAIYHGEKKGKSLGKGGGGKVKLIQNIKTGKWEALKVINTPEITPAMQTEIDALQKIKNEKSVSRFQGKVLNVNKNKLYIGLELASGNTVRNLFVGHHQLKEEESQDHLWPAIVGMSNELELLHKQNVVHRDIKGQNYLYDPLSKVSTIIDFGSMMENNEPCPNPTEGTTLFYVPPELLKHLASRKEDDFSFNFKTDIYTLGLTIAEMCGLAKIDNPTKVFSNLKTECDFYYLGDLNPPLNELAPERLHGNARYACIRIQSPEGKPLFYFVDKDEKNNNGSLVVTPISDTTTPSVGKSLITLFSSDKGYPVIPQEEATPLQDKDISRLMTLMDDKKKWGYDPGYFLMDVPGNIKYSGVTSVVNPNELILHDGKLINSSLQPKIILLPADFPANKFNDTLATLDCNTIVIRPEKDKIYAFFVQPGTKHTSSLDITAKLSEKDKQQVLSENQREITLLDNQALVHKIMEKCEFEPLPYQVRVPKEQVDETIDFLNRMTAEDPLRRPTIQEVSSHFNKLLPNQEQKRYAALDLTDYTLLNLDEKKELFLKLKEYDGIHLLALKNQNPKMNKRFLLEIQNELKKNNIPVALNYLKTTKPVKEKQLTERLFGESAKDKQINIQLLHSQYFSSTLNFSPYFELKSLAPFENNIQLALKNEIKEAEKNDLLSSIETKETKEIKNETMQPNDKLKLLDDTHYMKTTTSNHTVFINYKKQDTLNSHIIHIPNYLSPSLNLLNSEANLLTKQQLKTMLSDLRHSKQPLTKNNIYNYLTNSNFPDLDPAAVRHMAKEFEDIHKKTVMDVYNNQNYPKPVIVKAILDQFRLCLRQGGENNFRLKYADSYEMALAYQLVGKVCGLDIQQDLYNIDWSSLEKKSFFNRPSSYIKGFSNYLMDKEPALWRTIDHFSQEIQTKVAPAPAEPNQEKHLRPSL